MIQNSVQENILQYKLLTPKRTYELSLGISYCHNIVNRFLFNPKRKYKKDLVFYYACYYPLFEYFFLFCLIPMY